MLEPSKDVLISFAKKHMQEVFGTNIPPCYLAGGAYKSVLHHKPPNDLDIFAASTLERERLIYLLKRRFQELTPAPGAQRFLMNDCCLEVPYRVLEMDFMLV